MVKKIKILIAEDEEVNFLYVKEVLSELNYEILHAWDGNQAIELFVQEKPELVIMDIKMPYVNGYEALKLMKEKDSTIPVIALTAHALTGDKEKALRAGFDAYLAKPVLEETIINTIKDFLK